MTSRRALTACVIGTLFWASGAAADTAAVRLVWERPVGSLCPAGTVLEADVERLMQRRVFTSAADARVVVHGRVHETDSDVRVSIEALSASGELLGTRVLEGPVRECAQLRDAIGLVLTVLVERIQLEERSEPGALGLGGVVSLQSSPLPRTSLSAGLTLSYDLGRRFLLRGEGAFWFPYAIETPSGGGAKLLGVSVALRACPQLLGDRSTLGVRLCACVQGTAIMSEPQKLSGPERQLRLVAQGALEVRLEKSIGRAVLVELAAGPLATFNRPEYAYLRANGTERFVYQPARFGVIVQLALIILTL